ncbi:MAG: hypothetical protein ACRDA5_11250, partial [Clostridium sp.]
HKSNLIEYKGYVDELELYEIHKRIEYMLDLKALNSTENLMLLKKQKEEVEKELEYLNKKINKLEFKKKNSLRLN